MINVFRFSTWNQLSGLRSLDYPFLRIDVVQFSSRDLDGTKIDIIDTDNNIIYFSGFVRVDSSARFDPLAVFEVDEMIKRINAYGFNIDIEEPTTLPPNVITMLKGLYALGYNFITMQYSRDTKTTDKSIYQTDIDATIYEEWQTRYLPPPFKAYSNKFIVATKNLTDIVPKQFPKHVQPNKENVYVISTAPEFNWEDFKWVQPTRVYSIELLINPEETWDNPLSNAIVDIEGLPGTGDIHG